MTACYARLNRKQKLQGLLEASALIKDCPVSESAERLKDILMGDIAPEDDVVVLGFEV